MDSLKLGELTLAAHDSGIGFILHDDPDHQVIVPDHKIGVLRAFLDTHCPEERRLGFRVPLRPLPEETREAFEVALTRKNETHQVDAVDLSLTGVLVDVAEEVFPGARRVKVTLSLHDDSVTIQARVVRRVDRLLALHFPECVVDGELDPPEALLGIYRSLELDWLKKRVRT